MVKVLVIEPSKEHANISIQRVKKIVIDFDVEVEIFDKSPSIII
jgi:hypothetical protein